jgi:hypothetical protein
LTGSMPILHFSSAVKVAIGAFLLGCSVCTRHIGPPSIGKVVRSLGCKRFYHCRSICQMF